MGASLKLKEICTTFKSDILVNKIEKNTGEYPVFGAKGIATRIQSYQQSKPYISIIKWGAGVGRAELRPAYSSIVATMLGVMPNENVDLQWLCYLLQSMHLEKYATNAVVPNLYFKDYCTQKVSVPDYMEQKEISHILGSIQQIIEHRKEQLETLDYIIKARFVEMFGDPDINPKGWDECELNEKINVVGGYAFKSDQFDEANGIPVLRIGNINAGFFRPINLIYWQQDANLEKYAMYPGDLVMSLTGTVGKDDYGNVCILGDDYDMYYLNQRNAKLEIKEGIDKYYLAQLLKFEQIKKRLTGISRGVRQANISNKDILNLIIPVPPIDHQNQFAAFVYQVDKSKVAVQKVLEETQTLFDSLMQKYFG